MGFLPTFAIFCPLLEKKVGTKNRQIIYYFAQNRPKMGVFGQNNILFGGKIASVAKNPLFFFMIIIINIINKKVLSKKSGFLATSSFFG